MENKVKKYTYGYIVLISLQGATCFGMQDLAVETEEQVLQGFILEARTHDRDDTTRQGVTHQTEVLGEVVLVGVASRDGAQEPEILEVRTGTLELGTLELKAFEKRAQVGNLEPVLEDAEKEQSAQSKRKTCRSKLLPFCLGLYPSMIPLSGPGRELTEEEQAQQRSPTQVQQTLEFLKRHSPREGAADEETYAQQESPTRLRRALELLHRISPRDRELEEDVNDEQIDAAREEAREFLSTAFAEGCCSEPVFRRVSERLLRVVSREELHYECIVNGEHDVGGFCMKCMCTDDKHRPDCLPCKHGIPCCEAERCAEVNGDEQGCPQCSIGLEFVPADGEILKCNHLFCTAHIKEYEAANQNNPCPMCRAKIEYREKCLHCNCRFEFYADRDADKTEDDSITIPCKVFYWSYLTDRFEEYKPRDKCYQPQDHVHRYHLGCYQELLSELGDKDPCFCPVHRLPSDDDELYKHYVGYLQLPGRPDCHTQFMLGHIEDMQPGYKPAPLVPPVIVNGLSSLITTFGGFFSK